MLNLKPNEPNKDLSLYPNSGWFEATHYRRCFDLVPAAGTEFIFSSVHSSGHLLMLFRAPLDPLQCHLKITSNRNVEIEQAADHNNTQEDRV